MPHRRRSNPYQLRTHQIDPLITYDGIKDNPLCYIDFDIHPIESNSLCLVELDLEYWTIDPLIEKLTLTDPYLFSTEDEQIYIKNQAHPLKWFFELIQKHHLTLFYSNKQSKLIAVYSFQSKFYFNLFAFYHYTHENEKIKHYFKHSFTFDDYRSLSEIDENLNAMNIIDFIYQEIQATTMIDYTDRAISFEYLLNNDLIRLKDHQIKSINWMLKREQENSSQIVYTPFHRCHDLFEGIFYVHIISGLPIEDPTKSICSNEQFSLSGGILCDEMGLGKTMCVLLTSLVNPCPDTFVNNSSEINSNSNNNDDDNNSNNKRIKLEHLSTLPCLCGKLIKKCNETTIICSQCTRLMHRKCYLTDCSNEQQFRCPYCEQQLSDADELLSTHATLIVTPAAILDQWIEEIHKHLNCPLKIFIYESIVNKIPIPSRRFLAEQDFIFCSYENLRKDIYHNDICSKEHHATRTQQRKYQYLISPLLRLKFWRLVLDEAQMVDSPKTPAAKMARSLVSHHRWFVTGTPFHRSIDDLEGIIQYLFPLNDLPKDQIALLLRKKDKINQVFLSWLLNFLQLVTRRTSRQCLNDLPEQFERVIRLQFSELERTYYDRIWDECRDEFKREFHHLWEKRERERNDGILPNETINWTLDINNDIDMNDIHFLSSAARSCLQTPLIKLRCLCDHPQVGAYGVRHNDPALVHYYNRFHYSSNRRFAIRNLNNTLETNSTLTENNQPFTMKDLLDLLTARELESGEDSLRLASLNFNGLASLYLMQYEHPITRSINENNNSTKTDEFYLKKTIQTYERVIEISQNYKEQFHPDSFQLAHAFYNLSYSLGLSQSSNETFKYTIEQTLEEFNRIKTKHQKQSENEMSQAWTNFNEKLLTNKQVETDVKNLVSNAAGCIKPIESEKLDIHYLAHREKQLPFTTWKGFLLTLVEEFDRLKNMRENLLIYIENLQRQPTDDDITLMASCSKCGLENNQSNDYICIFCEADKVMKSYNCSLQPELYSDKQMNEDGGIYLIYYINETLSKASMRSHDATRQLSKLLRTDWNELLKKLRLENTSARQYSQQLKHLYLSLDEMRQCTSRLEFYSDHSQIRSKKTAHNRFRFNAELIEQERLDFEQQALDYLKKVVKHRQQFQYFQEQQQDYHRSLTTNQRTEEQTKCPMCHELFGDDRPDVCFFLCGHFFCRDCSIQWKKHELNQRPHRTHIKCPICRREIPVNSLTVLKWRDQKSTNESTLSPKKSLADDLTSPRIRRLIETQEHLTIQGRYGTKVDSIVSFILNLLHDDTQQSSTTTMATTTTMTEPRPPLKILVFSQFTDVLNVLATSLKLNAISFLQFSTTKILQQFRQDPSISVLLMPLGKGANGLNLTEAQHVILVEPQLHRSVELQAIARVRRLGQKYNTFVYRFIVSETAEEVVLASSRTAQTLSTTDHQMTTASDHRITSNANRAASFADFELLYEINMARKIFFKPTNIVNNQLD